MSADRRLRDEELADGDLTLSELDTDQALTGAIGAVHGTTRADLLRRAAVGGAALLAASAAPAEARAGGHDISILNYALTLEYLQDSFYAEVESNRVLHGPLARQARVVAAHERAHVQALRHVLGRHAVRRPRFDFRGATEDAARFRRTAVAFEDLAAAAYKGQAPAIHSRAYLVSALAIHTVEARHAAWIRRLAGVLPASSAFDEPSSRARTLRIVDSTNFVVQTRSRRRPPFTG
jgi:ferritin-like protein